MANRMEVQTNDMENQRKKMNLFSFNYSCGFVCEKLFHKPSKRIVRVVKDFIKLIE